MDALSATVTNVTTRLPTSSSVTGSLPRVSRNHWPRLKVSPVCSAAMAPVRKDLVGDLAAAIALWGAREGRETQEAALRNGQWAKLICGASFEDVVDVRNLSLMYTLVGIDCIDCAAEKAVVAAVLEGVEAAVALAKEKAKINLRRPWLMVSINDEEDPHFRKAAFDPGKCPSNCPRPCEKVCPAEAIKLEWTPASQHSFTTENTSSWMGGVQTERCYGCGRCLPVCPLGIIEAKTYVRGFDDVANLLNDYPVDAIEIHTGPGHLPAFEALWRQLGSSISNLKLVAVSLPDLGNEMAPSMISMWEIMKPYINGLSLWQLDGRPMSGDIGDGSAHAAVKLARKTLSLSNLPPGFLQLAGGTNNRTVPILQQSDFFQKSGGSSDGNKTKVAGVAYGGYARKIVTSVTYQTGNLSTNKRMENNPAVLLKGVQAAAELLAPLKSAFPKKP